MYNVHCTIIFVYICNLYITIQDKTKKNYERHNSGAHELGES